MLKGAIKGRTQRARVKSEPKFSHLKSRIRREFGRKKEPKEAGGTIDPWNTYGQLHCAHTVLGKYLRTYCTHERVDQTCWYRPHIRFIDCTQQMQYERVRTLVHEKEIRTSISLEKKKSYKSKNLVTKNNNNKKKKRLILHFFQNSVSIHSENIILLLNQKKKKKESRLHKSLLSNFTRFSVFSLFSLLSSYLEIFFFSVTLSLPRHNSARTFFQRWDFFPRIIMYFFFFPSPETWGWGEKQIDEGFTT